MREKSKEDDQIHFIALGKQNVSCIKRVKLFLFVP